MIAHNLCPFARVELEGDRIRFALCEAGDPSALLDALAEELERLTRDSAVETTLLIHPQVLQDFYDYNDFLDQCDRLLLELQLEGVFQIASFHPQYQFAGTDLDDPENYANRSPYPMLHLLREDSVTRAVARHPDIDQVPVTNIDTLNRLGSARLRALQRSCLEVPAEDPQA